MKKTKVIAFFNQKGGVGKSDVTNAAANEVILQELFLNKKTVSALVIDADDQQSIAVRRTQDINAITQTEFSSPQREETVRAFRKRISLLHTMYPIDTYTLLSVNSEDSEIAAISEIKSGKYDYAFIDMPGTMSQDNIDLLYNQIQYLYIPLSYNVNDANSSIDFYNQIKDMQPENIIQTEFVFNRYSKAKEKAFSNIEDLILEKTGQNVNFKIMEAKQVFDEANSFVPISLKINLIKNEISSEIKVMEDVVLDIIKE